MTAADQSLAKQALARQDLKVLRRRERQLRKYIAKSGHSHAALQEAVGQLDDLMWERSTVEMALATYQMPDVPTPLPVLEAMVMTQAEQDHAAGMVGGPEPTAEQRQRWADADVQYDAYYQDRGIA